MKCRACKQDHDPMLTCQRAARMLMRVVNESLTTRSAGGAVNTDVPSNMLDNPAKVLDKRPKFDKVAYQRDYMRKRRAAAKKCT